MFKVMQLSPIFILAATICISGASCHDPKDEDKSQSKPSMNGGQNRMGTGIVPSQQIQPKMNRTH
jgi:hypothetical protein